MIAAAEVKPLMTGTGMKSTRNPVRREIATWNWATDNRMKSTKNPARVNMELGH